MQSDRAFLYAEHVLGDARIAAQVLRLEAGDGQHQVRLVVLGLLDDVVAVVAGDRLVAALPGPVVGRGRIRLDVARQSDLIAEWCADGLIRYPDGRRDCNERAGRVG